ncbi:MAG: hypothetical protein FRX49_11860 [Trebouxia sp. A1-2]|nr:MAG: hypothetical protein FRX49_11860 [Trebouxia sp. A1-2]
MVLGAQAVQPVSFLGLCLARGFASALGLQQGGASEPLMDEAAVGTMQGMLTENVPTLGIVTYLKKNLSGEMKKQHWEAPETVAAWEKWWKAIKLALTVSSKAAHLEMALPAPALTPLSHHGASPGCPAALPPHHLGTNHHSALPSALLVIFAKLIAGVAAAAAPVAMPAVPPGVAGAGAVGTGSAPAVLPETMMAGSADLLTHAAGPARTEAVAVGPVVYASGAAATDHTGSRGMPASSNTRPADSSLCRLPLRCREGERVCVTALGLSAELPFRMPVIVATSCGRDPGLHRFAVRGQAVGRGPVAASAVASEACLPAAEGSDGNPKKIVQMKHPAVVQTVWSGHAAL